MILNRLSCIIYHVFANFETLNMAVGIATILETESQGKTAKTHLVCLPILTQQQTCLKLLNSSMELQLNISHYMYNYLLVTTDEELYLNCRKHICYNLLKTSGKEDTNRKSWLYFYLMDQKIYYLI